MRIEQMSAGQAQQNSATARCCIWRIFRLILALFSADHVHDTGLDDTDLDCGSVEVCVRMKLLTCESCPWVRLANG